MTTQTLGTHLDKLKPVEKGMIVWALNMTHRLGYRVHYGMLPFVSVQDALAALDTYVDQTKGKSVLAIVKSKLRYAYGISESVRWAMVLNPAKVVKRFGAHPERGHKIPLVHKKRVTVGVRWNLPKKAHEPDDDVLVQPHVILEPCHGKKGWFYVTCEKRYRNHVTTFLMDYCQ